MIKNTWKLQLNILWLGQAFMLAILAMSIPYWPLYIDQLGISSPSEVRFWSAAICVAPFATAILCAPLWGKIGDKCGYKPMVVRAAFGIFLTQTLILLFTDVQWILMFRVLQGILGGFIVSAQSFALAIAPEEARGATLGKLQSATAIGGITGPVIGGLIASYADYHAIFLAASLISGAITLAFFLFLKDIERPENVCIPAKRKASSFSIFQSEVLVVLLVIMIIQLAEQMITPVFALFATEKLGVQGMLIGCLYAAPGIMIFIMAPHWGKLVDKLNQKGMSLYHFISLILFVSAGLQFLHAFSESFAVIFTLRLLWGMCLGALLPLLLKILVEDTDQGARGVILGIGNSATKLGTVLGILLGALIESQYGYANSFLIMGILYVAAGLIMIRAQSLRVRVKALTTG